MMSLGHLAQIDPSAFAHPYDLQASEALKKVPFLPNLLKQVSRFKTEEYFRAYYMHNGIVLGPRQLPSLWRMVHDVADRFEMNAPVKAYVIGDSGANAFAFGMAEPSIALTSSLVDMMSDRELEAIIAHEFAHILCQHMLYRQVGLTLARGTTNVLRVLPALSPAALRMSLHIAFRAWSRAAEYSADRAAVLVMQDPEVMASCLSRLAGVPRRYAAEFDPHQFAEQVEEFERDAGLMSQVAQISLNLLATHPEPTKRAVAVLEWADSSAYERILRGDFKTEFEGERHIDIEGISNCPGCHRPVGDLEVCGHCGLEQTAEKQTVCPRGHVVGTEWKYCLACGWELTGDGSAERGRLDAE